MGTLLSQFSMSHMPNLVFISAPLTHTKGDLVLQAGLNGALIALKFSVRSNNEAFKIGILRRRQELGRNFKCL